MVHLRHAGARDAEDLADIASRQASRSERPRGASRAKSQLSANGLRFDPLARQPSDVDLGGSRKFDVVDDLGTCRGQIVHL